MFIFFVSIVKKILIHVLNIPQIFATLENVPLPMPPYGS